MFYERDGNLKEEDFWFDIYGLGVWFILFLFIKYVRILFKSSGN